MAKTQCGFDDVAGASTGSEMLSAYGPTLIVDIGFDPDYDLAVLVAPRAGVTGIHALVDTGAAQSCVDSMLAAQLGRPIVDKATVAGVGGGQEVNMHVAQVFVPSLNWNIYGLFAGV